MRNKRQAEREEATEIPRNVEMFLSVVEQDSASVSSVENSFFYLGVIIDARHIERALSIDPERLVRAVQKGLRLDQGYTPRGLESAAALARKAGPPVVRAVMSELIALLPRKEKQQGQGWGDFREIRAAEASAIKALAYALDEKGSALKEATSALMQVMEEAKSPDPKDEFFHLRLDPAIRSLMLLMQSASQREQDEFVDLLLDVEYYQSGKSSGEEEAAERRRKPLGSDYAALPYAYRSEKFVRAAIEASLQSWGFAEIAIGYLPVDEVPAVLASLVARRSERLEEYLGVLESREGAGAFPVDLISTLLASSEQKARLAAIRCMGRLKALTGGAGIVEAEMEVVEAAAVGEKAPSRRRL